MGKEITLVQAVPVLLLGREHGFRLLPDHYAGQVGSHLKRGMAAGLAHTVLPWAALREEIAAGALVARRLVDSGLWRTAMMALSTERPAGRAHPAAASCIAGLARELMERGEWRSRLADGGRTEP